MTSNRYLPSYSDGSHINPSTSPKRSALSNLITLGSLMTMVEFRQFGRRWGAVTGFSARYLLLTTPRAPLPRHVVNDLDGAWHSIFLSLCVSKVCFSYSSREEIVIDLLGNSCLIGVISNVRQNESTETSTRRREHTPQDKGNDSRIIASSSRKLCEASQNGEEWQQNVRRRLTCDTNFSSFKAAAHPRSRSTCSDLL